MTSTTLSELIGLLRAKGFRQIAHEVSGQTATYLFVHPDDGDVVTVTGPVNRRVEVEEATSARGFLASLCGRADCGCVYHAEQGIPCEHDLAQSN